jgi:hypothetical protein
MNAKGTMNLNLRNLQEQVEDSVKGTRQLGRKTALIYAGLLGLAYDQAKQLVKNSMQLVDQAEERGETIVSELNHRAEELRSQANLQVLKWRDRVDQSIENATFEATEAMHNAEEMAEKAISRMSADKEGAAQELRIDGPMNIEITTVEKIEVTLTEPVGGYDEMNVKEIAEQVQGWDATLLEDVRAYELTTKNRITVLRAIDERMESMTPVAA